MHYKIVAVHEMHPENPAVTYGEFEPRDGQHNLLTALNTEHGVIAEPAVLGLKDWSGGEADYWADDLADCPGDDNTTVVNGDYTYHVEVSDESLMPEPTNHIIVRTDGHGGVRVFGPSTKADCKDRLEKIAHRVGDLWHDNVDESLRFRVTELQPLDAC